uniref:Uncharacterized protein n=1 Tax=Glossina austeni TaxID=7395 RepID=A0A1A9VPD8_GLOAU
MFKPENWGKIFVTSKNCSWGSVEIVFDRKLNNEGVVNGTESSLASSSNSDNLILLFHGTKRFNLKLISSSTTSKLGLELNLETGRGSNGFIFKVLTFQDLLGYGKNTYATCVQNVASNENN